MFRGSQKGVSIYLAIIIMFILLSIALGVSVIIVSQMKMIRGMGNSVIAFYAADTGIERSLYATRLEGSTTGEVSGSLSDPLADASYNVTSPEVDRWKSIGSFEGVKRAIEISFPTILDFGLEINPSNVTTCKNAGGYPFDAVTVTATLLSGSSREVTFSTDGAGPDGEGYFWHSADGAAFKARFTPLFCDLDCSSMLDLTVTTWPPLPSLIFTTIKVYGTADGIVIERELGVTIIHAAFCPVP